MISLMRTILVALLVTQATQVRANECPAKFLKQGAVVFDLALICITEHVPHEKVKHAAHVPAQWLENNQDGEINEMGLSSVILKEIV